MPKRFLTPFVFAIVLAIGLLAAVGVNLTARYEQVRDQRALQLEAARSEANLVSAIEWQAIANQALSSELSERYEGARTRLLAQLGSTPADTAVHEQAETYLAAVEDEFLLIAEGRFAEAETLDEERVDPSFDALTEGLSEAAEQCRAAAERADTVGTVASTAIPILSALVVGILLWAVERSSRRTQALAAQEAARRESDERLRPVQERLQELAAVVEATPDLVVTLDGAGDVRYFNGAVRAWLAPPEGPLDQGEGAPDGFDFAPSAVRDLVDTEALQVAIREGSWTGDAVAISGAGRQIPTSLSIVVHRDAGGAVQFVSTIARDMSAQKELEDDLRHQAFHDPLTGLANRARFIDRLDSALTRARRTAENVAVIFLDLDDFKAANDSHGHDVGDALLVAAGRRLVELGREGDTLARLGGDEFALLLDGSIDPQHADVVAERLVELMRAPFNVGGLHVLTTISAGVALSAGDQTNGSELLRRADLAMYTSKANGKNRSTTYDRGIQQAMGARLQLVNELQGAVVRNEFILHYQPTVDVATGQINGAEALVRWQHPERGLLSPLTFIPLAEESGVIVELGRWVLREACAQLAEWHRAGTPEMTVAVNVAARQLQADFPDTVRDVLDEFGLPARCLTIEITESATMQDLEATARILTELKALGVRLAIDDFGTGYSSLSYLRQFPFDILKIDRSFISTITTSSAKLTSAIASMAKSLGLEVVAEGVEEVEQLAALRLLACETAQGYLFSRPVPADEISAALIEERVQAA